MSRMEFGIVYHPKVGRNTSGDAYLVKEGYARVATYPPNVKYVAKFKELENYARTKEIGLWSQQ